MQDGYRSKEISDNKKINIKRKKACFFKEQVFPLNADFSGKKPA